MKKVYIGALWALVLTVCLCGKASAQDYSLGIYTYSTGVDASLWRTLTATSSICNSGDDQASGTYNIGFNFPFANETFTRFSVNSNGTLKLGNDATGTGSYDGLTWSDASSNNPKVVGMGCDGYLEPDTHHIYKQTFGDTLLVVEFCIGTYSYGTRMQRYAWQVQLYKSGKVMIVYSPDAPSQKPDASFFVGMCVDREDGWIVDSLHVGRHFTSGSDTYWDYEQWPGAGRYYCFAPPVISCARPYGLTASNVSASGFTFAWADTSGASRYKVSLLRGSTVLAEREVSGLSSTFSGLDASTDYTLHVSAICGAGDTSFWNWAELETPCATVASLPYRYGFEDATASGVNGEIDACWQRHAEATTQRYPYPDRTYSQEGNYSLHLVSSTTGVKSWVSLPEMPAALNTLVVGFWALRTTNSGGRISIGAIDYASDLSTFDRISTVQVSTNYVWEYFEVPLTSYSGSKRYLTLLAEANDGNEVYIDEVFVGYPSVCTRPTSYSVSGVGTTMATLNIVHPTEPRFTVVMNEVGIAHYDTLDGPASMVITGLLPGRNYEGRIYTNCGSDTSYAYLPFSFATACASAVSLPASFGAEGLWGGTSSAPTYLCWNVLNTSSSYCWRPAATGANVHSGEKAFYFYGTTSSYTYFSMLMTPPINFTGHEEMTFWMKANSSNTTINYLGNMAIYATRSSAPQSSDRADYYKLAIRGEQVDTTTRTVTASGTTWKQYKVVLPDTLIGLHRLAFTVDMRSNTFFLDDIYLYTPTTCPGVSGVSVPEMYLLGDSALVQWTDTSNTGSYVVTYWPETATSARDSLYAYPTTTQVRLRGLQRGMRYYVSVTAQCGGTGSAPSSPVSFQTECAPIPIADMPYRETFETYTSGAASDISSCWYKMYVEGANTNMHSYPYPYSGAATQSSGMGLYFHANYSGSASSYAVLPEFELPYSDMMIEFDLKRSERSSYKSLIYLGTMVDPSDASSFRLLKAYDLSSNATSSVEHYTLSLEGFSITGRLAFFAPIPSGSGQQNHIYLDNLVVSQLPACRWPVDVAVDSVAGSMARLTWTGSSTASYEMQSAMDVEFTTSVASQVVTGTTGVLSGLLSRTAYYVRVRKICTDGSSSWGDVVSFRTRYECGSTMTNVVDTIGRATNADSKFAFYAQSSNNLQGYSSSIFSSQELIGMGLEEGNLINGISLYVGSQGGTIYKARIYMKEDVQEIFHGADTINRGGMTLVYSGDLEVAANGWVEIPFRRQFAYTGNSNLVITFARDTFCSANINFRYSSASGARTIYGWRADESSNFTATSSSCTSNRPNVVFDVCTSIPTCSRPTGVKVASMSNSSIGLTWQGSASSYQVLLSTVPVNPATATSAITQTTTTNSATVGGLTANTTYYYYVKGICGSESSQWSVQGSVRTSCNPQSVPYVETFERYEGSPTASISSCWVKHTNNLSTQYPYPYYTPTITGSRLLIFHSYHDLTSSTYSYAALPMFDEPISTLTLSFAVRCGTINPTSTTRLVIGVMSNPEDISTFEPYDTLDLHNQASNTLHGTDIYFDRYTGSGLFIALYCEAPPFYGANTSCTSMAYVDDVTVSRIPTCDRPTDITFSAITHNSAVVGWQGNASRYEVEYGPAGFTQGQGTTVVVSTNSLRLTQLDGTTTYDVYVRARCSNTDVSNWSYVKSFTTTCAINSLPMFIDPADYTASVPTCWNRLRNNSADYPKIYSSSSYAYTGTRSIYYYVYSSNSWQTMILPEIDASAYPIRDCRISFWARASRQGTTSLIVGAMTDPTDDATFVPIATHSLTTTVSEYTDTLSAYTGSGSFIAFKVQFLSGSSTYCGIDDILIEYVAPCATVYDLHSVGASATTADLAWTDTVSSTSWWVRYAPEGSDTWTEVPAGVVPFTLAGLQPGTTYRFRAASVCANGSRASWSTEVCYFTTAQAVPATMPYTFDFEDATEWQRWQTTTNSSVDWARGTAATGNATTSAYVSLDGGYTHSWDMATRTTAIAYRDINFGANTGSYQVEFDAAMGGTIGNDNDGLAVMLVDPSIPIQTSTDPQLTPWGRIDTLDAIIVRRDTSWAHYYFPVDNTSGVRRLVLYHFNQANSDASTYIDYPSAVDNLSVAPQACPRPRNLALGTLTDRSAQITWQGESSARYIVAHRVKDSAAYTYDTLTGTSFTLTGLTASTEYEYQVVRLCTLTATDTLLSDWSRIGEFTTPCYTPSARDTIHEGFEDVPASNVTYAMAGELPDCWLSYSTGRSPGPHVTDVGSYAYWKDGRKTLTLMASLSNQNFGPNTYVAMPYTLEQLNKLTLSFWYCFDASSSGTLTVGYLAGDNLPSGFVPIKEIRPTTNSIHIGNGWQSSRGVRDSISFNNVPDGNFRIAFRFTNNASTAHCVCLDDLYLWYGTICPGVTSISQENISYHTATLKMEGSTTNFTLVMGTHYGYYTDTLRTTNSTFNLTGLRDNTKYYCIVRADCDSVSHSAWREFSLTTVELPCGGPTMFRPSSVTYSSALLRWKAHKSQMSWRVHIFAPGFERWDTVYRDTTSTDYPSATVTGLYSGTRYNVAVFPLCAVGEETYWSDTTYFTTLSCSQVGSVEAAFVGTNEAVLTWTGTTDVYSYAIEYGYEGLYQGGGSSLITLGSAAVLTGLDPATTYDVYIRSRCALGLHSLWSNRFQFTTATEADTPSFHTVSLFASNRNFGRVTGGGYAQHDSELTISATAIGSAYRFVGWSDGVSQASRTLTVTSDTVLVANFRLASAQTLLRTVSVVPNNSAWGHCIGGGQILDSATCHVLALPAEGCTFIGWSNGGTSAVADIEVTSDTTLVALFTPPVGITAPDDGSLPLTLYPNPASQQLFVATAGIVDLEIVDLNGRIVLRQTVDSEACLDVSRLAAGAYFVRATSAQGFSLRKLIIR
ncbi:MAG: fibronectin type III domain-containing protein [Bacteroidales bacterium]|nr:fibronectin type III domain-containing protein [Bacteroidales bacterium]